MSNRTGSASTQSNLWNPISKCTPFFPFPFPVILTSLYPCLRFTHSSTPTYPNSSAKSVKSTGMKEKTTLTGRCIQDAEKKHQKTSSSVLTGFSTAQRISSLQRALGAPFREADRWQRQRKLSPDRQKFPPRRLGSPVLTRR